MKVFKCKQEEVILGRLDRGDDLLQGLIRFCEQNNITCGCIYALGALEHAVIGYYDQSTCQYNTHAFDHPMEITSLVGNISRKNKEIFVHCHITVADAQGRCFGGHLMPGNITFACEFSILPLICSSSPTRTLDPQTGLFLW